MMPSNLSHLHFDRPLTYQYPISSLSERGMNFDFALPLFVPALLPLFA